MNAFDLWLPIVVAGMGGFFASFLAWAILPHHKPDWRRPPEEDALLAQIRAAGTSPGQYLFPFSVQHELKDPDVRARWRRGPHGTLVVWPGPPNMGRNLALTVASFLACAFLMAYVLAATIPAGASFGKVFQVAATIGVMAHVFGAIPGGVWFGKPLRAMATDLADGVLYGLVQGLAFAVLWPELHVTG